MVEPVTLRITSRSSRILGFGHSTKDRQAVSNGIDSRVGWGRNRRLRTHLNVVLAHPGKSLHFFGGISVFRAVSGWVGHVLLGDCIVTVTHGLLG